jgi:type-F conjugative transfer system pilin assembly protein TrbC
MAKNQLLHVLMIIALQSATAQANEQFKLKQKDLDFTEDLTWAESLASQSKKQAIENIRTHCVAGGQCLAEQGSESDISMQVFVSSSMGKELLKRYVVQAKYYGAPLILRGLPGESWRELTKLIYSITEGDKDGVLIQIDDLAFDNFAIKSVPSFILARSVDVFASSGQKAQIYDRITGNIGIKRALEIIAKEGDLKDEAKVILERKNK